MKVYDDTTNKEILAVYKKDPLTGKLIEVPISEYLNDIGNLEETVLTETSLKTERFDRDLLQPYASQPYFFYKFLPLSRSTVFGSAEPVSKGLLCPNRDGCPIVISNTYTFTRSYSSQVSIDSGIASVVSSSIGYSYTTSKSGSVGEAYTMKVPYNRYGQVAFKPKLMKINGTLEKWEKYPATEYFRGSSPMTLLQPVKDSFGEADGYFLLIDYLTGSPIME